MTIMKEKESEKTVVLYYYTMYLDSLEFLLFFLNNYLLAFNLKRNVLKFF